MSECLSVATGRLFSFHIDTTSLQSRLGIELSDDEMS